MSQNMLQKPDVIIWDWDGTVVDTLPQVLAAHNHVRKTIGLPLWNWEEFNVIAHSSTKDIYPTLYGKRAQECTDILYGYYDKLDTKDVVYIEHAQKTVALLHETKIPNIVVSNKRHHILSKEIEHGPLEGFFHSVVGAGKAEEDKPSASPAIHALDLAKISAHSVKHAWFIGDSQTDVDCAKNLPFDTCSIVLGKNTTEGHDIRFNDIELLYTHAMALFKSF